MALVERVEQDIDALSEESFDLGHFAEFDSDIDETRVEDKTLDPFTAAQREEVAEAEENSDENFGYGQTDEKFDFTQKLLTNAQTLKQLQTADDPALDIAYESEDDFLEDRKSDKPPSQNVSFALPSPTPDVYSYRATPQKPVQSEPESSGSYVKFNLEHYRILQNSEHDSVIVGHYHSFPAQLLKGYSFQVCKLVLDCTRLYAMSVTQSTDKICIKTIYEGISITRCPVFKIISHQSSRVVLLDADEGCTVIGLVSHAESLAIGQHLKLIRFHYDHLAIMASRAVTMTEELDESFYGMTQSSTETDTSVPVAQRKHTSEDESGRLRASEALRRSILIVDEWEQVHMSDLEDEWEREASMVHMYETEVPQPVTVGTQETDYSDPFGEQLNMQDFPIDASP